MTRHILIGILVLAPFWVMGQRTMMGQKSVRITGTVAGGGDSDAKLSYDHLHLDRPSETLIPVRAGEFSFEFKLKTPAVVDVGIAGQSLSLYLEPGDQIALSVGEMAADSSRPIEITGPASPQNRFFQAFQKDFEDAFSKERMEARLLTDAVDLLELDLYDQRKAQKDALNTAVGGKDFPAGFRSYLENQIRYNYYRWLISYPIVRANANSKRLDVMHLPKTIEESIDGDALVNESAMHSEAYREFVWYYVTYFVSAQNDFMKFRDFNTSLNMKSKYAEEHLSGQPYLWYLSRLALDHGAKAAPGPLDRLRETIRKEDKAGLYHKRVDEILAETIAAKEAQAKEEAKANNSKGSAPSRDERYPVRMVDLDGKSLNLSDFKGKVVYIDFWASWCGPCRGQMPYSKKLKVAVHDKLGKKKAKDIVFLYISIDQDEKKWKDAIDKMGIEGAHAYSNARWPDGAGAVFQISGIPRYMIMDKNGEIVIRNAKRPSMEGVLDDLIKLL